MEQENLNENGHENLNKVEMLKRIQGKCARQRALFTGLFFISFLYFFYNFPIEGKAESIRELLLLAIAATSALNIWWYGKMSKTDDVKRFLTKWVKGAKKINLVTSCLGGFTLGFYGGTITGGDFLDKMGLNAYLVTIALYVLLATVLILIFIFNRKLTKDDDIKSLREFEGI